MQNHVRIEDNKKSRHIQAGYAKKPLMTIGQGSTGNVIAALASFFIPGLGQLIQGRLVRAILFFIAAGLLWIIFMGWIIHIWAILDAALWKPSA